MDAAAAFPNIYGDDLIDERADEVEGKKCGGDPGLPGYIAGMPKTRVGRKAGEHYTITPEIRAAIASRWDPLSSAERAAVAADVESVVETLDRIAHGPTKRTPVLPALQRRLGIPRAVEEGPVVGTDIQWDALKARIEVSPALLQQALAYLRLLAAAGDKIREHQEQIEQLLESVPPLPEK